MGMRKRLLSGTFWLSVAKIIVSAFSMFSVVILARLLAPEDYGLVAIATAVTMVFSTITNLALSSAIIQLKRYDDEHFDTAWTLGLIRSFILSVIVVAIAKPIAFSYDDARLINVFYVLSLSIFVGGFSSPKLITYIKKLDFRRAAFLQVTDKFVSFIVAIPIAYFYRSYWALVLSALAASVAGCLLSYYFAPYRPKLSFSRAKQLMSFSIWVTLGRWVQTLNWRADPLVLGYFMDIDMLGQLRMGQRTASMLSNNLLSPVAGLLFPALTKFQDDLPRLRKAYLRSVWVLTALFLPMSVILIVLAEPIVGLILGAQWDSAVIVVQIMAAIMVAKRFQRIEPLALATGNTKALFRRDVRSFFIRVPIMAAGIYIGLTSSVFLLVSVLCARALASSINIYWNMTLVRDISQASVFLQLSGSWRSLCAGVAMTAALFWLKDFIQVDDIVVLNALTLLSVAIAGILVYIVFMGVIWRLAGAPEGVETDILGALAEIKATVKSRGALPAALKGK